MGEIAITPIPEEYVQLFHEIHDQVNLHHATPLYHYAKEAKGGAIVDLGTWQGGSAITMALGTRAGVGLKVYTVDAYTKRSAPYGPQDKEIFLRNVDTAGVDVELIEMDVDDAAVKHESLWERGLALVYWEIGGERIGHDFGDWSRFVIPGGFFLAKDTRNPFGSDPVILEALRDGSWSRLPDMLRISVLVKGNCFGE